MATRQINLANYQAAAGRIVREGRLALGMTQEQLGHAIGLSQGQISRIEAGSTDPPGWLIMYYIHNCPGLAAKERPNTKQLRALAHRGIDKVGEMTLTTILALIEHGQWARVSVRRPKA